MSRMLVRLGIALAVIVAALARREAGQRVAEAFGGRHDVVPVAVRRSARSRNSTPWPSTVARASTAATLARSGDAAEEARATVDGHGVEFRLRAERRSATGTSS